VQQPSDRLRAGLYQRVSNDPQQRSVSPAQQEHENRAWCQARDLEVAWSITDAGFSASRHRRRERPGWDQVKRNVSGENPVDVLVAWEASRVGRDLVTFVELRQLCEDNHVTLAYKNKIYDFHRTDDRFTAGLDALLGEREADEIRERVLRSVRHRMDAGLPHGRVAYGYLPVYDKLTGAAIGREIDPEQAEIVREVYRRLLAGDALYSIAADLNRREVPSPQAVRFARQGKPVENAQGWTPIEVRRLVLKATNAGLREHKGMIVGEGSWPAIIDQETYSEAVALISNPARRTWTDGSRKHLLTRLAACGVCGSPCRRVKNRDTPSYMCDGSAFAAGAASRRFCVSAAQQPMDAYIESVLIARLSDREYREAIFKRHDDQEALNAQRELAELEARLESFVASAFEPHGISPAMLARMEAKYRPLIEQARARAVPTRLPADVAELATADDVRAVWEGFSLAQRRQVVRDLLVIYIHPVGPGTRFFDPNRVRLEWI
jgi:DNA invertase Pin-like site-specific DNA recombinase